MANISADPGYEELFVRVVPVEVCCLHSSTNGSRSRRSSSSGINTPTKHSHCFRMNQGSHASERYPDSPQAPVTPSNLGMPPAMNPAGLYPTLGSTEVQTCFCPNCNGNSYTSADGYAGQPSSAGGALQASASCADAGMAAVAVQRITVRVMSHKTRYGANGRLLPGCYKLELSSDASLFFLFVCNINEAAFQEIKEACDLSLSFQQLPGLLLQLLDLLVRQPSTYLSRLMMQQDGTAALEFAQTLGFKTISLLVLPRLEPGQPSLVRSYVTARHSAVVERCAAVEAELAELKALVRQRCPNLLITNKNTHREQHHTHNSTNSLT